MILEITVENGVDINAELVDCNTVANITALIDYYTKEILHERGEE